MPTAVERTSEVASSSLRIAPSGRLVFAEWFYYSNSFAPADSGNPEWRHEFLVGADDDVIETNAGVGISSFTESCATFALALDQNTGSPAEGSVAASVASTVALFWGFGTTAMTNFRGNVGLGHHYLTAIQRVCNLNGSSVAQFGGDPGMTSTSVR